MRRTGFDAPRTAAVVFALAALASAWAADDAAGFLYGRVVEVDGTVHEGRMRWIDEEASWGDFFDASREERPYLERIPEEQRRRGTPIKILGLTVGTRYDDSRGRSLRVRFGDLAEIHPHGGDAARLVLKSGTELEVRGGSNDLGARILVWNAGGEEAELDWDDIESIVFSGAPDGFHAGPERLYGTLHGGGATFSGFIQWDQTETLAGDRLDGESDDGTVALDIGRVREIERSSAGGVLVVLDDGTRLHLRGTNDVDDGNRGIFVDDERFGRVLVSWEVFERLELSDPPGSGPAYDDFPAGGALRGAVTDVDGEVRRGRIVFDLDESETWDILDGDADGVTYSIPMGRISSIVPEGEGSRVELRGGVKLHLRGSADVGEGNDGVAVIGPEDDLAYSAWDRVRRIDFD